MPLLSTLLLSLLAETASVAAPAKAPVPAAPAAGAVEPGLVGQYFQWSDSLSEMPEVPKGQKPDLQRVDRQINFPSTQGAWTGTPFEDNFYVRWTGRLRVPKAGTYTFFLNSDDGSRLVMDGRQVVLNGGTHDMIEIPGTIDLTAGDHEILVEYFESELDSGCILSWQGPDLRKQIVPAEVLFHPAPGPTK
ncbi:MAG: PA14 domain-containing protein [Verrucomicrobiota bacterium]